MTDPQYQLGRLAGAVEAQEKRLNGIDEKLGSFDKKLDTLLQAEYKRQGRAAIVGGGTGAGLSLLLTFLKAKFFGGQ